MSQFADVELVLHAYFDGLYHSDRTRLADVFHPKAIYATANEMPFLCLNMEEYFSVIEARESPASRKEERYDLIDGIEFAGENTAFARVRCSIGSRDYLDFLTLICIDGKWWIISKVFHIITQTKT